MRLQRNLITMKANRWYNTWNNSLVFMDQSINWIIEYNYVRHILYHEAQNTIASKHN